MKCLSCDFITFEVRESPEGKEEQRLHCSKLGWSLPADSKNVLISLTDTCRDYRNSCVPTHIFRYWLSKFVAGDFEYCVTATSLTWEQFLERYQLDKVKIIFHDQQPFNAKNPRPEPEPKEKT